MTFRKMEYPKWRAMYRKHFPERTDPFSRHARIIGEEELRHKKSPARKALLAVGYDPDHWAHSIEWTVANLWEARAEIERLKAKVKT